MQLSDAVLDLSLCRRRPYPSPILAGTIPCPECGGSPLIRRHTPNWARLTQTEVPFDFRVCAPLMPARLRCCMPLHETHAPEEERSL